MVSYTLHFQLHPIKALIFCYIVSFNKFLHGYFRLKYVFIKDSLLNISKLQTASFYHKNFWSYKLLNMTTPNKTLCTIRNFSFKNKACNPIYKLLNTLYEHYIDKKQSGPLLTA